jgi:hypothetical protein
LTFRRITTVLAALAVGVLTVTPPAWADATLTGTNAWTGTTLTITVTNTGVADAIGASFSSSAVGVRNIARVHAPDFTGGCVILTQRVAFGRTVYKGFRCSGLSLPVGASTQIVVTP